MSLEFEAARGGWPRNGASRSSGGRRDDPERARTTLCSSGASGSGSSAATYAERLRWREASADAERVRLGRRRRDRQARRPSRRPRAARSARSRPRSGGGRAKRLGVVGLRGRAPRPRGARTNHRHRRTSPATLLSNGRRDAADELARAVEHQPLARSAEVSLGTPDERLEYLRLDLRSDPGHAAQPPGRGRLAKLVGRMNVARRAPARSSASSSARDSAPGRSAPAPRSRSSSASSAISPVSTSSLSRASIPGPIPRRSRTGPVRRPRSSTGKSGAADRLRPRVGTPARCTGWPSARSSSAAKASRRSAICGLYTRPSVHLPVAPTPGGRVSDGACIAPSRSGERSPTDQACPNGSRKPPWRWVPHGTS